VRDIRVEGVQRTEAGTIFSYLPIKVGGRVDDRSLRRLAPTRPASSATCASSARATCWSCCSRSADDQHAVVRGNKFDTETVKKALKDIGLAEARIFDRSSLEWSRSSSASTSRGASTRPRCRRR
jgi:outer membrane protein insertion porin family